MFFYLPLGLGSLIVFTLYQIIYLPYAWYYVIKSKRKIAEWSQESGHSLPPASVGSTHWIPFIFFGPVKLIGRMILDTFQFFVHLFIKISDEEDGIQYLSLA